MRTLAIFPWAMDSEPAERLRNKISEMLGYKVVKVYGHNGRFVARDDHAILNWGRSDQPDWYRDDIPWLNWPHDIYKSVHKDRTFEAMKGKTRHVEFTFDKNEALNWLEEGAWVCCRTKTKGYDGDGLILAKKPGQLTNAPLYTLFHQASHEYRVYVFHGRVIDWLIKVDEGGTKSKEIRTEGNGWEYARTYYIPEDCKTQAIKAIKAVGLDFGGVDVLYCEKEEKAYVLETNTAPDILGRSVTAFAYEAVEWLKRA